MTTALHRWVTTAGRPAAAVPDDVDARGIWWVRTDILRGLGDPMLDDPWGMGRSLTHDDIAGADLLPCDCIDELDRCPGCEARRIAFFVHHGIDAADPRPISVDVGVGSYWPDWFFGDGNHRIAAGIVTQAVALPVAVFGDLDRAQALLIDGLDLEVVKGHEPQF